MNARMLKRRKRRYEGGFLFALLRGGSWTGRDKGYVHGQLEGGTLNVWGTKER